MVQLNKDKIKRPFYFRYGKFFKDLSKTTHNVDDNTEEYLLPKSFTLDTVSRDPRTSIS